MPGVLDANNDGLLRRGGAGPHGGRHGANRSSCPAVLVQALGPPGGIHGVYPAVAAVAAVVKEGL